MKKISVLFLVLSLLLMSLSSFSNLASAASNPEAESMSKASNQDPIIKLGDVPYAQKLAPNDKDAVTELLSSINFSKSDTTKPRGRFLVRLRNEYEVRNIKWIEESLKEETKEEGDTSESNGLLDEGNTSISDELIDSEDSIVPDNTPVTGDDVPVSNDLPNAGDTSAPSDTPSEAGETSKSDNSPIPEAATAQDNSSDAKNMPSSDELESVEDVSTPSGSTNEGDSSDGLSELGGSSTVGDTPTSDDLSNSSSITTPDDEINGSAEESIGQGEEASSQEENGIDQELEADQLSVSNKLDVLKVKSFEGLNTLYMELSADEVNQLLNNPMVASIEEDKPIEMAKDSLTQVEDQPVKQSSQTVPWGIHSTGAYLVQEREPLAGTDPPVKIAVFDTGISNHPDLNIVGGASFIDDSASYEDDNGHGTHIAGTIAASNNSIGVVGVAPESALYSVKVMDSTGTGYTSSVIQGLDWAIQNDIDIVNMSFVTSQMSDILHEAIQRATNSGILIVAAAGNNGLGDTVQYPAKYPEVIAVGAIDSSHHRTDYSSTGDELDLVAPGFGVLSTTRNGEYGVSSGTSIAAAHVTGSAALLWSHHREWTSSEVVERLYNTATPLGETSEYGHGLVNVAKAEGVIDGTIAPLSDENLSGLNTIIPTDQSDDLKIASYDKQNDGATIHPGDSITVSLKLEGDQNGNNPHTQIDIEVYPASNPSDIIATRTVQNPQLDTDISYTWQTASSTPTGTYYIKYHYVSLNSSIYDDIFVIYVTQPDAGPDTYEPNDTFLTAKSVSPGNSYISYVSSSSDIDYYKLEANQTGQVSIDLLVPSSKDFELYVYNESGNQVGQSSNGAGLAEHVDLQVHQSSNYYIKVVGFSGQFSTSPYTLTLGEIEVQLLEAPTGLEAVPHADSIKLTWDEMPEATSYLVQLDGQQVGSTDLTSYTFTNLNALTGYTLSVAAVYEEGISSYSSIQASTTIPELIVYQPRDIDQPGGTSQLYSFTPASTGVYRFYTGPYSGTGGAVDTQLHVYSDLQLTKEVANNDDNNDSVFSEIIISLVEGQTYYVQVSGFDTTPLHARVTAEVVSSTIPYIQLNQPVDVDQQAGDSNVYLFVPPSNGKYRITTSRYNGTTTSRLNDTELAIYTSLDMVTPIANGYNDDKDSDTVYSEAVVNLSAGTPYYVRIDEVSGGKVHARLLATSAGSTSFTSMQIGTPVDLSQTSGEQAYLQFTPTTTGKYRFFTSNYQGTNQINDTEIALYSDNALLNLLDRNDDVKGYKPYGELFSKLEVQLNAGTTYYLAVRGFGSKNSLQSRFMVEGMEQSNTASARTLPFGELIDTDTNGNPTQITSLYDVDYYRIELSEPEQINLYLSDGEGAIEDTSGNVRGYFSIDGQQAFELEAGSYYLRIENDTIHTTRQTPAWSFVGYSYELSADINEIEYTHGNYGEASALRILNVSNNNVFDATPGSGDSVTVNYKNKTNHSELLVQVTTRNDIVYETTKNGDFQKNELTPITWNGEVNPNAQNKRFFANYADVAGVTEFWAKDGVYYINVFRLVDGHKKKDAWQFVVQVFNDPLNHLNVIPLPPKYEKNKEIKAKDMDSCQVCLNYFDRYILAPDTPAYYTAYSGWFEDTYGMTGIRKFIAKADQLFACNIGDILQQFQCTLDTIGMVPFIGEGADAVNGVIYLVKGEYANALLSSASIIPILGDGFAGAKKFTKIYKLNPCGCLAEGTLIKTKDGEKPIEQIKVGDLVLAKDTDTGIQAYKPVETLFSHETNEIYTLKVAGKDTRTTSNHPFWVKEKGWVTADELTAGDELETDDGTVQKVDSISLQYETSQVYNFTVKDFHTYYISDLGLLTHNLTEACQISNYKNLNWNRVTKAKGTPSQILEAEIKAATGLDKPTGWAAHHIVPYADGRFDSAKELRNIFKDLKIDLNSAANGVYLPKETGVPTTIIDGQTIATHNGGHAQSYYNYLYDQVRPVKDSRDDVLDVLEAIREDLLEGRIHIGNVSQ